ncbi:hypothetical protein LXA43DRAFT_1089889 [Ganoderma leucocontextum]|nr:hypothetical protein LXA43DRAFT_1089889 [Ganoderma leucocontextum]
MAVWSPEWVNPGLGTNSLLDTFIAYAVTTGLLTDVINILGFVFALVSSQNLYYAALNTLVSKVYTNSVMAALNFRRPREPVWTQCTGVYYDTNAEHISLPETSPSREIVPQRKGLSMSNVPLSVFSNRIINIKAEKDFTCTRDSDERVNVCDLEHGPEDR